MPTRKQRRRQQKTRRHDWEYVYVDDAGNEVDVDPEEVEATKQQRATKTDARARRNGKPAPTARQSARRTPQPPSWRRAIKRAAILGVFFVVVFGFVLRGKDTNIAAAVGVRLTGLQRRLQRLRARLHALHQRVHRITAPRRLPIAATRVMYSLNL